MSSNPSRTLRTPTTLTVALITALLCVPPGSALAQEPPGPIGIVHPSLKRQIEALQFALGGALNRIQQLENKLACVTGASDDQNLYFEGCNVYVQNGTGQTETRNEVGNLIIGYHEPIPAGFNFCSDGQYALEEDCLLAEEEWGDLQRTGSHNLIVGSGHHYTQYGGIVVGERHLVNGPFASVSGGIGNRASGRGGSVSGGEGGRALGEKSSVSGGWDNIARGERSSVSGGNSNDASGRHSSVAAGNFNRASGDHSSVAGGGGNHARGDFSTVTGGDDNLAGGRSAVVLGGAVNEAGTNFATVVGGRFNTASGRHSSVGGGSGNVASGDRSSVVGGRNNLASGDWSSVSGGLGNRSVGETSSISGGQINLTIGELSSISGGFNNETTVPANLSSILGGNSNIAAIAEETLP